MGRQLPWPDVGAGLDIGAYVFGSACALSALGALGWGAVSARRALLPNWMGSDARLAEATIGLSLLFAVAQVIGSVGLLRLGPLWVGEIVVGLAVGLVCTRRARPERAEADQRRRLAHLEVAVAAIAVAVVAVQWSGHVGFALAHGMTHPDTLWYHLPFAADFVQQGSFGRLPGIGYPASLWFPLDSQLLHSLAFLPFRRDVLSPYLNLGWAGLAALAAWCIGRRRGAGAVSLGGAAVVLGLPVLAGTQPGQASSDIACAALFLTAIALVLASDLAAVPLGIAGAATGLAISTKVTVAVPVLALVLLVFGYCLLRRHLRAAAAWIGGIVATGSFWFVRNWVLAGNPVPWFKINLGPLSLRASAENQGPSLVDAGLANSTAWHKFYLPGLHRGLGAAWIAILVLPIGAAIVMILHRRRPLDQIVGAVTVIGVVGYLFTPLSAGFSFVFNLRYLSPMLLVGFVVMPLALPSTKRWRIAQLVGFGGLLAVGAAASHHERVPAWPRQTIVPGVAALILLAVLFTERTRQSTARPVRPAIVLTAVMLAVVAIGWPLQRTYLEHRYSAGGFPPNDGVAAYFRRVTDARVVLFGGLESYPLFGPDWSNRVRIGSDPVPHPGPDPCRWWRSRLGNRYDYVVLTEFGFGVFLKPPEAVLTDDRAATLVLRKGDSAIFRIRGRMHPEDCPTPAR